MVRDSGGHRRVRARGAYGRWTRVSGCPCGCTVAVSEIVRLALRPAEQWRCRTPPRDRRADRPPGPFC